jgi:2-isopropylmalate synthase
VGQPATRLVLGRHSGLRGLDARCRALGYRLRVDDLRALYTKMIDATDFAKSVDDADLAGLIRDLEAPPFDAVGAHMRDSHDDAATRHTRW